MLFYKLMRISVGTDLSRPYRQFNGQKDAMNRSLQDRVRYEIAYDEEGDEYY